MKSIDDVYNLETLISEDQFVYINQIISNNNDKKFVCFGAGTATTFFIKKFSLQDKISFIVDNNVTQCKKNIFNIKVVPPTILKKQSNYFIFILSRFNVKIKEQLISYGLVGSIDFIDIYDILKKYFRVKKFKENAQLYEKFLLSIPKKYFKNIEIKDQKKIGIVCIASILGSCSWYSLTLALMLIKKGYNVTLIIDTLKGFYDITLFEGHTKIISCYIAHMIEIIKTYIPDLDVKYINNYEKAILTKEDKKEIQRLTELNVIWHNAMPEFRNFQTQKQIPVTFSKILSEDMEIIKGFFLNNKFDIICVPTALHRTFGLYMWEGIRHNIRVANYDGYNDWGETVIGTDYPSSHFYDIRKIITKKMFSEDQIKKIIVYAKDIYNNRIYAVSDGKGHHFQLAKKGQNYDRYDVIMTMNVSWDAAALGLSRIFNSYDEWVIETVKYIIQETNLSVIVREHPICHRLQDYTNKNWKSEINELLVDSKRCKYCTADEKVNTYELMQHAKVVLPYSSTTGLEAVMLGIPIITHTKCYYDTLKVGYRAVDKEDYFALIKSVQNNSLSVSQENKNNAFICFACAMEQTVKSNFREELFSWMNESIENLLEKKDVQTILKVIADDIPVAYTKLLEKLK